MFLNIIAPREYKIIVLVDIQGVPIDAWPIKGPGHLFGPEVPDEQIVVPAPAEQDRFADPLDRHDPVVVAQLLVVAAGQVCDFLLGALVEDADRAVLAAYGETGALGVVVGTQRLVIAQAQGVQDLTRGTVPVQKAAVAGYRQQHVLGLADRLVWTPTDRGHRVDVGGQLAVQGTD